MTQPLHQEDFRPPSFIDTTLETNNFAEPLLIARNKILDLVSKTTLALRRQLNAIIDNGRDIIRPIIKKATILGLDTIACTIEYEERFSKVLSTLLNDGIYCISKEVKRIISIIKKSILAVKNTTNEIKSFPGKLLECNDYTPCVMSKIGTFGLGLPSRIISETAKHISGLHLRLLVCVGTQLSRAGVETIKIASDVIKCIIEHHAKDMQNNF